MRLHSQLGCTIGKRTKWQLFVIVSLLIATTSYADDIEEMIKIRKQVQALQAKGKYREAIPLAQNALQLAEKSFADKPAVIAHVLTELAHLYLAEKKFAEAEPLIQRSLKLREKYLGPDHAEVATGLTDLATVYDSQGKYSEAEPLFQRALKIFEKNLGPDHLNVATCLSNLAGSYHNQSKYSEEEPLLQRALRIFERSLGPDHPNVATILRNLAGLYFTQSKYAEAELLYQRSLKIREKSFGADHPLVAENLNDLANLYKDQAKYAEAKPLYQRALKITEKYFGPEHPIFATSLNNLADFQADEGNYAEAESLHQHALKIREKSLGPDHLHVAISLNGLAYLFYTQGKYADAEPLYQRSLKIHETALGLEHHRVATLLNNLALLYFAQSKYAEAEPIYQRALKIYEKSLGSEHPEVANILNSLGGLNCQQGNYADAEPLYTRALKIRDSLGPDHPLVANSLNNLADLYVTQGKYAEAEPLHQRALRIREKSLGAEHNEVADSLHNLAQLCGLQKKYLEAASQIDRAIAILERAGAGPGRRYPSYLLRGRIAWELQKHTDAIADLHRGLDLAEQQRLQFAGAEQDRAQGFEKFLTGFEQMIIWQHELGPQGDLDEVVSAIERSRARSLLDDLKLAGADLDQGRTAEERERLRQNEARIKSRAAQLEKQFERAKTPEEREKLLPELAKAREAVYLEYRDRRASSPVYRQLLSAAGQPIRLAQLQQTLTPHQSLLLVYFLGERAGYLLTIQANQAQLTTLKVNEASAKTLGCDAGPLTLKRMQGILMNDQKTGILQKLSDPATSEQVTSRLAALWSVLVPEAQREQLQSGDLKQLMIVPDGPLSCLPFEALVVTPDGSPTYLLDVGPPIVYAPSATILFNLTTRKAQPTPDTLQPVLSVADATYSSPATATARGGGTTIDELTPRSRYGSLGGHLAPLPYTGTESDWVKESFVKQGTLVGRLLKDDATELNVRFNLAGRRVVHLACHGLADQAYGNFFGALALTPGQRANEDTANDGFLTLAEINQLDLKSCELAILSACETNFGPQQKGEGTWALSRGFIVAGAKRVVASNWLVDDEAAASLIYYFCSGLNQTDNESLDHAQALQTAKRLIQKQDRWKSPYYWATFVLVGPK